MLEIKEHEWLQLKEEIAGAISANCGGKRGNEGVVACKEGLESVRNAGRRDGVEGVCSRSGGCRYKVEVYIESGGYGYCGTKETNQERPVEEHDARVF